MRGSWCRGLLVLGSCAWLAGAAAAPPAAGPEPGLLFHLSADRGLTADYSAGGTPEPNFASEVTVIPDGAAGPGLQCGHTQLLSYWAPGNIHAQRGTLSFFWRSREPVGPTPFPVFRVGYADHSSWDMVWLRIDYNGKSGFDAFVTDASLARTRVSYTLPAFPSPSTWTHLVLTWDETRGMRFYVNGQLAGSRDGTFRFDAALDQFGPHSRIISPYQVQSAYNFVRGGDVDELRIYDRMLDEGGVAALAKGGAATVVPQFERDARHATVARRVVVPPWLEPARRRTAASRCRSRQRAQGRDPRRVRPQALVLAGERRHPRDDVAGRLQPLAPARAKRLLPAPGLGLLLAVGQVGRLLDA